MAVNHVSEVQAQNTFRVSILENKERVNKCQNLEEKEGRINTDLAHRFVIIGGTLVPFGDDQQAQLVQKVFIYLIILVLSLFVNIFSADPKKAHKCLFLSRAAPLCILILFI
jgi:hypothetical protein